jgi:hypothetical protein
MKILTCTLFLLSTLGTFAHAQGFVNMRRTHIMSMLGHEQKKYKMEVNTSDTTLSFKVIDEKVKPVSYTLHFNKAGKCDNEIAVFDCEECYLAELKKVQMHFMGWDKVDSVRSVTAYGKKLELTVKYQNQPYAFMLRKVE